MLKVTFILGLPGSGKTYLARTMLAHGVTIVDDFSVHMKESRRESLRFIKTTAPRHLILTDPMAVLNTPTEIKTGLEKLLRRECDITFIAFTNDVEACLANLHRRADNRHIGDAFVRRLSTIYDPTQYEDVRDVYRP